MDLSVIDAAKLAAILPMASAIDALERTLRAERLPEAPPRSHIPANEGELLLMPAVGEKAVGVKLVTVNAANVKRGRPLINGAYVLFSPDNLEPVALIDGAALTAMRTAALSAVATRHLAREDACRLVIFGAGVQARSHLEAMCAVRPIERVTVVSKSPGRAQALVERARALGLDASTGPGDAVATADIVCTCTTSPVPVFDGTKLQAGCHVNAIGAYKPNARELDDAAVRRARVVVETRAVALREAGDLVMPLASGALKIEQVVGELKEIVCGLVVRRTPEDITVFKSVGAAWEDLIVATAAYERCALK